MEKLSDLRNVSTQEFEWLKHKIDSLPLLKPYLFDNISLYPDCLPERTTIGFYRNEQGYTLFFNEKISYSGGNQILNRLFSDGLIVADTIDHLQAFCQQLPDESVNEPSDASPVVTVEDDITDFDAITIPKDEVVTLSFDFIRNELRKTVIGQDLAVDIVAYQLAAHLAKPNPKRPLKQPVNRNVSRPSNDRKRTQNMQCAYFWSDSDSLGTSTNGREKYCSGTYPGTAVGRPDTRQNGATWPILPKGGMNPNVLLPSLYSGFHPPASRTISRRNSCGADFDGRPL